MAFFGSVLKYGVIAALVGGFVSLAANADAGRISTSGAEENMEHATELHREMHEDAIEDAGEINIGL